MKTETYIEINFNAFENNIKKIKATSNKNIQCVVKANAYGHGDLEIAQVLEKIGINSIGVARVEEGVRLREHGITSEIIVLGGAKENEFEVLINNKLKPVVYSTSMAEKLNKYLNFRDTRLPVHIKFDTGMHRLGIPFEESLDFMETFRGLNCLNPEGLMSHFICAGKKDSEWNHFQIERFKTVLTNWEKVFSVLPACTHIENTAGFTNFNVDFVNTARLGIAIYGYGMNELKPVLRLYSVVKDIKRLKKGETVSYGGWFKAPEDMRVGIVPVGYGDGFTRANRKGSVLVNGKRTPIVGIISMDYFMIDITGLEDIKIGDRVTIIGEENDANAWARISGTIVYEVLTLLNPRIRRLYNGGKEGIN